MTKTAAYGSPVLRKLSTSLWVAKDIKMWFVAHLTAIQPNVFSEKDNNDVLEDRAVCSDTESQLLQILYHI